MWHNRDLQTDTARALAASTAGPAHGGGVPADERRAQAVARAIAEELGVPAPDTHLIPAS